MAKERIGKTLITLDENEVRQVLQLARRNDPVRCGKLEEVERSCPKCP